MKYRHITKWIIASETIRSFKDKHNHHSVRFREDLNRCWSVVNVDNRRKRTRGLPIPFVLLLDKKQHGTAGDTQLLFVLLAPCWLRKAVLASSEENEMLPDVQGINLWQKGDLLAKLGRWCTRSIERTLTTVMFISNFEWSLDRIKCPRCYKPPSSNFCTLCYP